MTPAAPASHRRPTFLPRALDALERVGNRLPDPITMFVLLAALVLLASWIASRLGLAVVHPKDGTAITAVNLLDRDGLRRVLTEAVRNFTGFAPLGTVLVAMIGVGVAEGSGLISAAMRALVTGMPRGLLTAAVVFTGVQANLAADAGLIVLPPIAALLFAAAGRHPLAGIAAAFAGVSGGFSANLLPSTLDVLLIGFTQEAVDSSRLFPGYHAQVLGNWYFLAASTPILTIIGTWVTHRFVEPRLGPWRATTEAAPGLDRSERRGLRAALIASGGVAVALVLLATWPGSPLLTDGATRLDRMRPFFDSMVLMVMIVFLVPGLAYGIAAGGIRSDRDAAKLAADSMASMGAYIVLAFAAAQFVSWFAWSNLAAIIAISGAHLLQSIGLSGAPLLGGFVVFSALLDLLTASASAKWAILAPVFVPMFGLLGFTPEGTQVVYRIGDSCTNMITPLLPYMPFMLAYMRRYDAKAGVGTLIAMMLPYFITFMIAWTALLLLFYGMDWPIGPGVGLRLPGH